MISAVLFDLDETLFDRTTSLVVFLTYQHGRFADRLGEVTFEVWRDRFLALDPRGYVHKSLVYLALLTEFSGDLTAVDALLDDYREHCREHARGSPGMAATLMALRSYGLRLGIVTNGETEFQTRHVDALGLTVLVDAVLISEAEGLCKPDAALFRRANSDQAPAASRASGVSVGCEWEAVRNAGRYPLRAARRARRLTLSYRRPRRDP